MTTRQPPGRKGTAQVSPPSAWQSTKEEGSTTGTSPVARRRKRKKSDDRGEETLDTPGLSGDVVAAAAAVDLVCGELVWLRLLPMETPLHYEYYCCVCL